MEAAALRAWLEDLDERLAAGEAEESAVALAFVAGQDVVLAGRELAAARRRAVLLLATGGDPRRELHREGRAVTALAEDLASAERLEQLLAGLAALETRAGGLERVQRAIGELRGRPDTAWRSFACALLAEELAEA